MANDTEVKNKEVGSMGPGTDSAIIASKTKDGEWMANQIGEYLRSGTVGWNFGEGIYMGSKEKYMEDPLVKKAVEAEYGEFNEQIFDNIYNTIKDSFTNEVDNAKKEYRNEFYAPRDPYVNSGDVNGFLSLASLDQRIYDDYSISIGDSRYLTEYSHREGKTDRVLAPDGNIYDVDYLGGTEGIKENDKFLKDGKRPIFFSFVGNQMDPDNKGGYIVPVYEGEDFVRNLITSNKDINDATKIYRESHWYHGIVKTPLNFLISSLDNIFLESGKNAMRLAFGEDAKNYSLFNTLGDWSGELNAHNYSYSDEANSLTSMEGILKMTTEVALQVAMMISTGSLGGRGLLALGVQEGKAVQYANWVARAAMTTYSAGDISQQGEQLGLSNRALALTWLAGNASLWAINSAFNWMEHAVSFNSVKNQAISQATKNALSSLPKGKVSVVSAFKAGENWARGVANAVNHLKTTGSFGSAAHQLGAASLNETFQEGAEFIVQEGVQNLSNLIRYVTTPEDERKNFTGYQSMTSSGYWTDYFFPAIGVNMLGGAMGGPIGRVMGLATGNRFVSADKNIITSALINGEGSALIAAANDMRKRGLVASEQLSTLKGEDGEFLTMAEAATIDPNPISLNEFAVLQFEDEINFQTKVLKELGIFGIGESKYASIKKEMPGIEDHVTSYDIGKEIADSYKVIQKFTDKGVYSESIAEIKDNVVSINEDYFKKLEEIDKDTEESEIDKEEAKREALRSATTAQDKADATAAANSNGKLTKSDVKEIREAIQYIEDVRSGKASEKLFVKFIYGQDKAKPDNERKFKMLDGNHSLESLDRIFAMANTLSEVRETLDARYNATRDSQAQNDKNVKDAKTYKEAVDGLKFYDGIIYLSDESKQELSDMYSKDAVSIDELKGKMKDAIDILTNDDLKEFLPMYKRVSAEATNYGPSPLKLDTDGNLDEAYAEKTVKDILKEDIDRIDSDSVDAFNDLKNIAFRDHNGGGIIKAMESTRLRNAQNTEIYKKVFDEALMKTKAESDEKIGGKPLDQIVDGITQLEEKDKLSQEHLLAGITETDGRVSWSKGFFEGAVKVLEDELHNSTNELTGINTFPLNKFDDTEKLIKDIDTRLQFLDFMYALEGDIVNFRDHDPNLKTLESRMEMDMELTRFNRAFDRILYNPARVADLMLKKQLGVLTDEDKADLSTVKQMLVRFKDSVDPEKLLELDEALEVARKQLVDEASKENPDPNFLKLLEKKFNETYAEFDALSSTTTIGKLKSLQIRLRRILASKDSRLDADNSRIVSYKKGIEIKQRELKDFILPTLTNIMAEYKDEQEFTNGQAFKNFMELDDLNESSDGHAKVFETIIALEDFIHDSFNSIATETIAKLGQAFKKYAEANGITGIEGRKYYMKKYTEYAALVISKSSEFFENYKGYIGDTSESTVGPILPFAANMEQIESSKITYSFFTTDDFNKITYKALSDPKSDMQVQNVNIMSKYIFAITGVLGSGKTLVAGMMPLKMAQDKRKSSGGKNLAALAVAPDSDQRNKLKASMKENRITTSGIGSMSTNELIIDMETNPDKYSNSDTDLGYIVIDEASFISNESETTDAVVTDTPSYYRLTEAIESINNKRTGNGIKAVKILLLGDPNQNGHIGKDSKGNIIRAGVFGSDAVLMAPYMNTSERSLVSVLKSSYNAWLSKISSFHSKSDTANYDITMEYGYDAETNDILGINTVREFSNLDEAVPNYNDQTIVDILRDKMTTNEDYTIAIVSNVIKDKVSALPPSLKSLYDEFGKDRVIVREHKEIQGREVQFVIAHIDSKSFGDKLGYSTIDSIRNVMIATTLGRATLGGVLINETGKNVSSKFYPEVKAPKQENVKVLGDELIKLQKKSLNNLSIIVPDGGAARVFEYGSQQMDDYINNDLKLKKLMKEMVSKSTSFGVQRFSISQLQKLKPIKNTEDEIKRLLFVAEYIMRDSKQEFPEIPEFTNLKEASDRLAKLNDDIGIINAFQNYEGIIINKIKFPFGKKAFTTNFNSDIDISSNISIPILTLLKKYSGSEIGDGIFTHIANPNGTIMIESPFEELEGMIPTELINGLTIDPFTGEAIVNKSNSEIIKENKAALKYYRTKETKHKNGNGPALTKEEQLHKDQLESSSKPNAVFKQTTVDTLIDRANTGDDTDYMKRLDERGIVGLYTGGFFAGVKGVKSGNASLVAAAALSLTDPKYKGKILYADKYKKDFDSVDSEYTKLKSDIMNDIITPLRYFMFGYKSNIDGKDVFNSLIAAELENGDIVVLGNFNNTEDAGDTLSKVQVAAKNTIDSGDTIMSEWSPEQFELLFPADSTTGISPRRTLSPGKLIPGKEFRSVNIVREMLFNKGYKVSEAHIVKDRNHRLSGQAVLFYSLNQKEDFSSVTELPVDSVFENGLQYGVGMIILYPTSNTISSLFNAYSNSKDNFIDPISNKTTPFYESLMMNRVNNLMVPFFAHMMHTYYTMYPNAQHITGTDMAYLEKVAQSARTVPKKVETDEGIIWQDSVINDLITPELTEKLKAYFRKEGTPIDGLFPVNYKEFKTPLNALMNSMRLIVGATDSWPKYKRDANGNILTIKDDRGLETPDIEQSRTSILSFFDANKKEAGGFFNQHSKFDLIKLFNHFKKNQPIIYKSLNINGKQVSDEKEIFNSIFGELDGLMSLAPQFTNGIRVYPAADPGVGIYDPNKTRADIRFYPGKIYGVGEDYLESNVVDVNSPLLYLSDNEGSSVSLLGNTIGEGTQENDEFTFGDIAYTYNDVHSDSEGLFEKLGLLNRYNNAIKSGNVAQMKNVFDLITTLQNKHIRLKSGVFQMAADNLRKNIGTSNKVVTKTSLEELIQSEQNQGNEKKVEKVIQELKAVPLIIYDNARINKLRKLVEETFSADGINAVNEYLIDVASHFDISEIVNFIKTIVTNKDYSSVSEEDTKTMVSRFSNMSDIILANAFTDNTVLADAFDIREEFLSQYKVNEKSKSELETKLRAIDYTSPEAITEVNKLFNDHNKDYNIDDLRNDLIGQTVLASVKSNQAGLIKKITTADRSNRAMVKGGRFISSQLKFSPSDTKVHPTQIQLEAIMKGIDYTNAAAKEALKSESLKVTVLNMYGIVLKADTSFINDIVYDEVSKNQIKENIKKIKNQTLKCI